MSLFSLNKNITPPTYAWAHKAWELGTQNAWHHTEASMANDVAVWSRLSPIDQTAIAGILQGFTQMELRIGEYWSDVVGKNFANYEVLAMARLFSAQESIHAYAYRFLEDSLGLDTYPAFEASEASQAKVELFSKPDANQLGLSLAVFSGAGEGVSLFSSFAILLSFHEKLIGLPAIISWSVRDEAMHSQMGIRLYHQLIEELPDVKPDADDIYGGFSEAIANELRFIQQAFANGPLSTFTYEEAEAFLLYRANDRLAELGLKPVFELSAKQVELNEHTCEWFNLKTQSATYNDFFYARQSGANYSATAGRQLEALDVSSLFG